MAQVLSINELISKLSDGESSQYEEASDNSSLLLHKSNEYLPKLIKTINNTVNQDQSIRPNISNADFHNFFVKQLQLLSSDSENSFSEIDELIQKFSKRDSSNVSIAKSLTDNRSSLFMNPSSNFNFLEYARSSLREPLLFKSPIDGVNGDLVKADNNDDLTSIIRAISKNVDYNEFTDKSSETGAVRNSYMVNAPIRNHKTSLLDRNPVNSFTFFRNSLPSIPYSENKINDNAYIDTEIGHNRIIRYSNNLYNSPENVTVGSNFEQQISGRYSNGSTENLNDIIENLNILDEQKRSLITQEFQSYDNGIVNNVALNNVKQASYRNSLQRIISMFADSESSENSNLQEQNSARLKKRIHDSEFTRQSIGRDSINSSLLIPNQQLRMIVSKLVSEDEDNLNEQFFESDHITFQPNKRRSISNLDFAVRSSSLDGVTRHRRNTVSSVNEMDNLYRSVSSNTGQSPVSQKVANVTDLPRASARSSEFNRRSQQTRSIEKATVELKPDFINNTDNSALFKSGSDEISFRNSDTVLLDGNDDQDRLMGSLHSKPKTLRHSINGDHIDLLDFKPSSNAIVKPDTSDHNHNSDLALRDVSLPVRPADGTHQTDSLRLLLNSNTSYRNSVIIANRLSIVDTNTPDLKSSIDDFNRFCDETLPQYQRYDHSTETQQAFYKSNDLLLREDFKSIEASVCVTDLNITLHDSLPTNKLVNSATFMESTDRALIPSINNDNELNRPELLGQFESYVHRNSNSSMISQAAPSTFYKANDTVRKSKDESDVSEPSFCDNNSFKVELYNEPIANRNNEQSGMPALSQSVTNNNVAAGNVIEKIVWDDYFDLNENISDNNNGDNVIDGLPGSDSESLHNMADFNQLPSTLSAIEQLSKKISSFTNTPLNDSDEKISFLGDPHTESNGDALADSQHAVHRDSIGTKTRAALEGVTTTTQHLSKIKASRSKVSDSVVLDRPEQMESVTNRPAKHARESNNKVKRSMRAQVRAGRKAKRRDSIEQTDMSDNSYNSGASDASLDSELADSEAHISSTELSDAVIDSDASLELSDSYESDKIVDDGMTEPSESEKLSSCDDDDDGEVPVYTDASSLAVIAGDQSLELNNVSDSDERLSIDSQEESRLEHRRNRRPRKQTACPVSYRRVSISKFKPITSDASSGRDSVKSDQRVRIPPLRWWAGETIEYESVDGTAANTRAAAVIVADKIEVPEHPDAKYYLALDKQKKMKAEKKKSRMNALKSLQDSQRLLELPFKESHAFKSGQKKVDVDENKLDNYIEQKNESGTKRLSSYKDDNNALQLVYIDEKRRDDVTVDRSGSYNDWFDFRGLELCSCIEDAPEGRVIDISNDSNFRRICNFLETPRSQHILMQLGPSSSGDLDNTRSFAILLTLKGIGRIRVTLSNRLDDVILTDNEYLFVPTDCDYQIFNESHTSPCNVLVTIIVQDKFGFSGYA